MVVVHVWVLVHDWRVSHGWGRAGSFSGVGVWVHAIGDNYSPELMVIGRGLQRATLKVCLGIVRDEVELLLGRRGDAKGLLNEPVVLVAKLLRFLSARTTGRSWVARRCFG